MNFKALVNIIVSVCAILYVFVSVDFSEGFDRSLSIIQLSSVVFVLTEIIFTYLVNQSTENNRRLASESTLWKINTVFLATCQVTAFFITIHILLVLFGAPIVHDIEESATLSLLLTSLVWCRIFITSGPYALKTFFSPKSDWKSSEAELRAILVLGGAWLGAIFIPLDWDRPWQSYPLTCCVGALCGEILSSICLF